MDLNGLRQALRREPFEPFTMRLADGRSERVEHPEFVAVGPRLAVVIREDNSWSSIEPLRIASLDYGAPFSKGPDGSGRKKRGSPS